MKGLPTMNSIINDNYSIYQDDCYKFIKSLPDKSVDCIIIDPPYEKIAGGGGGCFGLEHRSYLTETSNDNLWSGLDLSIIDDMFRVCKVPNFYVWCSKKQMYKLLTEFVEKRKCSFNLLTWNKSNPIPASYNRYLLDTEYCLFFRKGARLYGSYHTKKTFRVLPVNKADKKLYNHPTIKPVSILEDFIENSTLPGDTVLDMFMGTGSTGVAAVNKGRKFIGVEIKPGYFATASSRLEEAVRNRENSEVSPQIEHDKEELENMELLPDNCDSFPVPRIEDEELADFFNKLKDKMPECDTRKASPEAIKEMASRLGL
ncbi:site-specific DNA-methyltransferase [Campylobacter jejuni]|uniref:Methyltransferase n=2 Tax=Campylobacter jejuni TaxID=197 RepID=A0A431EAZ8_CAMJU|nr:site-specific DNA-methyltransferase [Campylobacter jejuni]